MYQEAPAKRQAGLEQLVEQFHLANAIDDSQPVGTAEWLAWQGIVLSTLAGEKGGLAALSLAKKARALFERSIAIDATALRGSALTSLGILYHKVPGWPVGFGSDKKAATYLARGIEQDPGGIDSNFFMAQYLIDKNNPELARKHLQLARLAKPRPDRALADAGRRAEVDALMQELAK